MSALNVDTLLGAITKNEVLSIAVTLVFLKKPPCDFVSGRFAGFATLGGQCLPLKVGKK